MKKQFKGKTVYINDGQLEEVRQILVDNGEDWRMGYDESYGKANMERVSEGYLYRTGKNWYLSLIKQDNLEVISMAEFKNKFAVTKN